MEPPRAAGIRERIEAIEEAYEYMLAYAAQGRASEGAGPEGARIRAFLARFEEAARFIADRVDDALAGEESAGFRAAFARDSAAMLSVLAILRSRADISSEMVDNANGLIAVRAYLTALFFLDKAALS